MPVKIELPDVTQVACANDYIILVDKHGQVFRVDDSSLRKNVTNAEVVKLDLSGVTKISCGINFSLALTDTGKVFVWGNNTCGQLGTGGLTNEANPVQL